MDISILSIAKLGLAVVGIPVGYFLLHFLLKVTVTVAKYYKNRSRFSHLPKHPDGNVAWKLMDLERDCAKDVPLFEKDHATGELFDLVDMGPDITGRNVISVVDAELVGQVLSSIDASEFPKNRVLYDQVRDALLGDGLVTSAGATWKMHRHLLTPLFHFKSLKDMTPMMTLYTQDLIQEIIAANKKAGEPVWHRIPSILSKFTLTQIIYLAFGTGMDLEWMHERQVRIGKYFAPHLALSMFFGSMIKYVPGTPSWKCTQTKAEIENYMYKFIEKIQEEEQQQGEADQPQNLVRAMLKNGQVTPREIVDEATTFLFAGFDTTATTLAFALWYLATHPDTMAWLQEEVDEVFGAPDAARAFKQEDLPLLKRTRAVINETLRLRPPANSISRTCDRDVKVGKYNIPAGSCVELRIFMTQRDPKYWKEPNSFIPQRWMDEEKGESRRHPFSFVPFSAGSRNCIGKNFAMQEAMIALSMLMSRFTVEMDESRGCEIKAAGVNAPHCWLKFHERAKLES